MCGGSIVEWMGGTSRFITFLTFFIHFIHPLFCIINYCVWVRYQDSVLGNSLVSAYLALTIIGTVFYLFLASIFYMWAWRFPEPEEVSKRRRIYGVLINLIFSDIPIFAIEVRICWIVQFASGIQGVTFIITCLSFFYSAVRVWVFFMIKLIKVRAPVLGAQPHYAGSMNYSNNQRQQGPSQSYSYPGNSIPYDKSYNNGSRPDYQNGSGGYSGDRYASNDSYRRDGQYNDERYNGDQYSTPGRFSRPGY